MMGVMMAGMMMVSTGGKCRAGNDHQQQESNKNLLHGKTLARCTLGRKSSWSMEDIQ